MSKFRLCLLGLPLVFAAPAEASILGPDAAVCAAGNGPAILVNVTGLKNRAGTVRARTFGGSPSTWFNKKFALKRTQIPTPSAGAISICMPVPKPGTYAVDIRHDVNNNGDTDRADGGGASGNPNISLWDVVFGRKPSAETTSVQVGQGVTTINIVVKYASGGQMKPVQMSGAR